jgi:hypothetical protein
MESLILRKRRMKMNPLRLRRKTQRRGTVTPRLRLRRLSQQRRRRKRIAARSA